MWGCGGGFRCCTYRWTAADVLLDQLLPIGGRPRYYWNPGTSGCLGWWGWSCGGARLKGSTGLPSLTWSAGRGPAHFGLHREGYQRSLGFRADQARACSFGIRTRRSERMWFSLTVRRGRRLHRTYKTRPRSARSGRPSGVLGSQNGRKTAHKRS